MSTLVGPPKRTSTDRKTEEPASIECLSFRVAGAIYALPVAIVGEIVRSVHVTVVPRAAGSVLGIASFRGKVVTIVDLAHKLGLTDRPPDRRTERVGGARVRILMVEAGETIGVVVDEVLLVHKFASREIERTAGLSTAEAQGSHAVGIARPAELPQVVLLLDAKAVIP